MKLLGRVAVSCFLLQSWLPATHAAGGFETRPNLPANDADAARFLTQASLNRSGTQLGLSANWAWE